ncbi:unnamed protein product [Owenia fusiformis]|uniref:Uncharacterized protein n=1 Tax=Owenia fusiformis TaxID=6347 RepID=A0A8J1UKA3_OWEFU|nr:unnamed protein product [Owenia fusiformis]
MPRGGGRGGGRGAKSNKKGRARHFTSPEEIEAQNEAERKQREWRQKQGLSSEEEDAADVANAAARGLPPTGSSSEYDSSDDEDAKAKGVSGLIEIENPNRIKQKARKVTDLQIDDAPQLSRKEREEIEKQKAKERYQKLHQEGKTDEARADLARLAIIRKQREDAAKKKADEQKAKEAAAAAKAKKS